MVIITNVVYSVTKATFRTLQRSNMDHLANVVNGFDYFCKKTPSYVSGSHGCFQECIWWKKVPLHSHYVAGHIL